MLLEIQKSVGENLKQLRFNYGYTQAYVASEIGVSRSTYISYEMGNSLPSTCALIYLSKLYNISPDLILEVDPLKFQTFIGYVSNKHSLFMRILDIFHALSPHGKVKLIEEAELIYKDDKNND